jgi:hypothetical protein
VICASNWFETLTSPRTRVRRPRGARCAPTGRQRSLLWHRLRSASAPPAVGGPQAGGLARCGACGPDWISAESPACVITAAESALPPSRTYHRVAVNSNPRSVRSPHSSPTTVTFSVAPCGGPRSFPARPGRCLTQPPSADPQTVWRQSAMHKSASCPSAAPSLLQLGPAGFDEMLTHRALLQTVCFGDLPSSVYVTLKATVSLCQP